MPSACVQGSLLVILRRPSKVPGWNLGSLVSEATTLVALLFFSSDFRCLKRVLKVGHAQPWRKNKLCQMA